MKEIKGLTINQAEYNLTDGRKGKMAVFIYSGSSDPSKILDMAVHTYVGTNGYHELIDAHLDNPWMRVVLSHINEMVQKPFEPSKDRMVNSN